MYQPGVTDNKHYRHAYDSGMETIEQFLTWAAQDRSRSPHTLRRYREALTRLSQHCDPLTASLDEIQTWWEALYHLSPATRANDLSAIRSYYTWALRFDLRADNPTRRIDLPKVSRRLPRVVGRADFERLLGPATKDHPELRRAYALGGYGGLRVSEAASLDWANIDMERRRMFVLGKGNKERAVPINAILTDYLLPALETGNVLWAGQHPAMTAPQLQRRINRHMRANGVDHTFHDLRKRGASILLSKGANPVAVQKMFGWASLDTVMHYAAVGDSELDKIAALLD